ncbi:MAG: catalase family peroxidase [Pseudohongiella sp.]|nr:catalase family peroxidase [Pseudohongiella sp.]MDP2125743.1 catalase family peroxidase [Pseudohongiella sp.]
MKIIMVSIVAAATSLLAVGASAQSSPASAAATDPSAMIDQFEATFGKYEGYRRSGAKGICAMGEFVGSAAARGLSTASVFSGETVPVIVRFSVGGANPNAPDNTRGQRNMALQFDLPGGEQWQMGNISAPVFGSSSPQQLAGLLVSRQADPATGAANPDLVRAFNEANPEVLLQGSYFASQPVPASYAGVNYWGVHAYGFVNAAGVTQYGKWLFEPAAGTLGLTDEEAQARGANFLFDDLRQRVAQGAVAFDFNLELAEPGDTIDNATVPLPEGREKVSMGTLKVTSVSEDAGGSCLTITFNPMIMPAGVVPSADPMLAARAAPYVVSLSRRLTEGAKQ